MTTVLRLKKVKTIKTQNGIDLPLLVTVSRGKWPINLDDCPFGNQQLSLSFSLAVYIYIHIYTAAFFSLFKR